MNSNKQHNHSHENHNHSHEDHNHSHKDHNHAHEDHNHSHDGKSKSRCKLTKTQSLIFMLCMTSSFFLVELIVGHVTKSNALVADAFHMLSDVISLVIGLVAVRMSKKTSERNTFGWVRAEVLGSLINSVFLLALCFSIVIEAINRFIKPEELEEIDLMLIVGGIGLGINLIGLLIFGMHGHEHGHSHGNSEQNYTIDLGKVNSAADIEITVIEETEDKMKNKKSKKPRSTRNMNIHGVFLHVLSDALGSIAVIISGLIVKFAPPKDSTSGWKLYIDPALSLIITVLITFSTIPLLREASLVLLQTVPRQFNVEDLKKRVKNVAGIIDVHHFHLWSLNSEKLVASAHLRVRKQNSVKELEIIEEVKRLLHRNEIHATTLQLEYDDEDMNSCQNFYDFCEGSDCSKKQCCVNDKVQLIKNSDNDDDEQKF